MSSFIIFSFAMLCFELPFATSNFFEMDKDDASSILVAQQNCCSNDQTVTDQKIMCSGAGRDESKVNPDTLSKFPWQVSILQQHSWRSAHIGSGSILSSKWVLTVAHIVHKLTNDQIHVVDKDSKKCEVARIIVHPSFSESTLENDIALLELVNSLKLPDPVSLVCIRASSNDIPCTDHCQIGMYSNQKYLRMKLTLLGEEKCKAIYQTHNLEKVLKADMECSENPTLDRECYGDSGAAMACPNNRGQIQLTGLMSWGWNCVGISTPAVFTKVSPYNQFIKSFTNLSHLLCQKDSDHNDETHINTDGIIINIVIPRKKIDGHENVQEQTPVQGVPQQAQEENPAQVTPKQVQEEILVQGAPKQVHVENTIQSAFPNEIGGISITSRVTESSAYPREVKLTNSNRNQDGIATRDILLGTSKTKAIIEDVKEPVGEMKKARIHIITMKEDMLADKNFTINLNLTKIYSTK